MFQVKPGDSRSFLLVQPEDLQTEQEVNESAPVPHLDPLEITTQWCIHQTLATNPLDPGVRTLARILRIYNEYRTDILLYIL